MTPKLKTACVGFSAEYYPRKCSKNYKYPTRNPVLPFALDCSLHCRQHTVLQDSTLPVWFTDYYREQWRWVFWMTCISTARIVITHHVVTRQVFSRWPTYYRVRFFRRSSYSSTCMRNSTARWTEGMTVHKYYVHSSPFQAHETGYTVHLRLDCGHTSRIVTSECASSSGVESNRSKKVRFAREQIVTNSTTRTVTIY